MPLRATPASRIGGMSAGPTPHETMQTLASVARRSLAGEDFFFCIREFLDDLGWADTSEQRAALVTERPPTLPEPNHGAFLDALAEHLAALDGRQPPPWSQAPERFLHRWWFPARHVDEALGALQAVARHLERRGLQGDLYVVGGAALALAYDARRTTRDVDAVFQPKSEIYAAAAAVALSPEERS